jgi:hypothetical protein
MSVPAAGRTDGRSFVEFANLRAFRIGNPLSLSGGGSGEGRSYEIEEALTIALTF